MPVKCSVAICLLLVSMVTVDVEPAAGQDTDFSVLLEDVPLRPGVTADLNVEVLVNEDQPCQGRTVLLTPGAYGTADPEAWTPFAEALFHDNPAGRDVCRLAVLDLPGHGGSGLPESADGEPVYGDLTQRDYARALIGALERLPRFGVRPKSIVGYSMSGLVTALAQQMLGERGTNLRRAFHVKTVLLVSPVPPAETPYAFADLAGPLFDGFYFCYTGPGGGIIPGCEFFDTEPDGDVDFHDILWFVPSLRWDCDPDTHPYGPIPPGTDVLPAPVAEGLCDPTTPLGDTVFAFGTHESATAVAEFLGALQYERPSVERGIFRRRARTRLWSAGLENDTEILPSETAASYAHYADDDDLSGYVMVTGPTAVHSMLFTDPEGFLEGIAEVVDFP